MLNKIQATQRNKLMMQIATWNVNSIKVRCDQVLEWLQQNDCDVLALQEIKTENHNFPIQKFNECGYQVAINGQSTYNGVAIISKIDIVNVINDIPNYNDPQKRVIKATLGNGLQILCVYVVNGESVDSNKYLYKMEWLKNLHNYIDSITNNSPTDLIILGDFNIAPAHLDVYDSEVFAGNILYSDLEHDAWHRLLELGFIDSFRHCNPNSQEYSWWDYRNFAFRRNLGCRIDHILTSNNLQSLITNCYIDKVPRKNERPSDHAPVVLHLKTNE